MPTELKAAQEYLLEVTGELVRNLQTVMNREDDRELDEINNQRQRYAAALGCLAIYFDTIGHDNISEIGKWVGKLAIALDDLTDGVTDPLFLTKGSKRDSTRIWGARMQAALGLECLIRSGLPRKAAAKRAAKDYTPLARLMRGKNRDLEGSLLSWRERFLDSRVPVRSLSRDFTAKYRKIEAASLSSEQYRDRGNAWLSSAVKSAKQ
jgi:hypothetical protein